MDQRSEGRIEGAPTSTEPSLSAPSSYAESIEDPRTTGGEITEMDAEVTQSWQAGYSLLNARLSYDFLDDRAQIALWGKNLINVAHFDDMFALGASYGTAQRWYQPPRTYGAELSYRSG